jgi:hypothetical protein
LSSGQSLASGERGYSRLAVVCYMAFALVVGYFGGLYHQYTNLKNNPTRLQTASFQQTTTRHVKSESDLVTIKRGFDWLAADSLKNRPQVFCKKLAGDFGDILDQNEVENYIDFFTPADSIPLGHRMLYQASARYLREHCGQYAMEWRVGSDEWKYYKLAVKFAVMSK